MITLTLKEPIYSELIPENDTNKNYYIGFDCDEGEDFGTVEHIDFFDKNCSLHASVMDFIRDLTLAIYNEIKEYNDSGAYPYDDATEDIVNALFVLSEVNQFYFNNVD